MQNITQIRLSIGSAIVLGLRSYRAEILPTTCYLMTYTDAQCQGHCTFCPQGTHASSEINQENYQQRVSDPKIKRSLRQPQKELLSRIQWPIFDFKEFIEALNRVQKKAIGPKFTRVCIQVLNYPQMIIDLKSILQAIHIIEPKLPISAAIPPIPKDLMIQLKALGLERIGIALDACTPELFNKIKGHLVNGPYSWDGHWKALRDALEIYGPGFVTTHFIMGLGETEEELINRIQQVTVAGIQPGIFCFTPIRGTPMENHPRPPIITFRRIQLARMLLLQNLRNFDRFIFHNGLLSKIRGLSSSELSNIIKNTSAFKTAGCPNCNRPYYTSSPGQEMDGFPRDLLPEEQSLIFQELNSIIDENLKH